MLTAHRTGELHKVAGDLAQEACYPVLRCPRRLGHWAPLGHSLTVWQVERQADDFQRLKERALESLLRMKRAGKLEDLAEEIRCSSTFILALLHVARVFRNDTCGLRVCVCVCVCVCAARRCGAGVVRRPALALPQQREMPIPRLGSSKCSCVET